MDWCNARTRLVQLSWHFIRTRKTGTCRLCGAKANMYHDPTCPVEIIGTWLDKRCLMQSNASDTHRAIKMLRKGKPFIVVAIDEPYFPTVYQLIRAQERRIGRWTEEDERAMNILLMNWMGDGFIPAATIRDGWELPSKRCPKCGATMRHIAIPNTDGWWLGYDCEACEEGTDDIIEWPFVADWVFPRELERLGFVEV